MPASQDPSFTRRVCVDCGAAALVEREQGAYRCAQCDQRAQGADIDPDESRVVSSWWSEASGLGVASGAFGALDEIFNPAAVRAKEQLKADHERQVPMPSPGDDAWKTGTIVLKLPSSDV